MRCLGTMEFLCDFYERCHLTQKELLDANQSAEEAKFQQERDSQNQSAEEAKFQRERDSQNQSTEEAKFQAVSDAESDKENALPPTNDSKRKIKTPDTKSIKNSLPVSNESYYKTERKNESSIHHGDTNNCTIVSNVEIVQPVAQKIVQLNNLASKKQSTVDSIPFQEKKSEDDQNTRITRSGTLKSSVNSTRKTTSGVDVVNSEQPVRRKRGRKSKLELMIDLNHSLNTSVKKEAKRDFEDKKSDDPSDRSKRHCLRAICTNNKLDTAGTSVISCKPQNEQQITKEQVRVETSSNVSDSKTNDNDAARDDSMIPNKLMEIENDENSKKSDDSLEKAEDSSAKSKAVSVIVKKEKTETENALSQQDLQSKGQYIWIPIGMLIQKLGDQQSEKDKALTHASPPPGDEAEQHETAQSISTVDDNDHSSISACTNNEDLRPATCAEQNRTTVIISSQQSNDIIVPEVLENDCTEMASIEGAMDQSTRDSLDSNIAEQSLSRRSSRDSSLSGNRSKDGTFGKISELISDEQKQEIETYYTVDMSIVNSEEVKKNITIVDKKNIRCNICGTLYLRMDKCQVHIWGHLKMKPYQCKACDFATVTVSNVRCHIRKSHLKIKPFACQLCGKRYVTAVLLEEHLNTHTGARPFKCKICDFASASRQMLSYHSTTHKPIKDISCKVCGKEFYSRGRLRAHMLIHNKDKVLMCKLCSTYLSNAEALEAHHKNIHMRDYICNVCGKRVKSRKALHNHQNVHAAAKYKCSLCPNVYKSSQILKEHLLKHEGIRKYKCNVCEKSFGQQSHLAAHMAVHSEVRFHCPGCDRAFNRHDNMKIHTKRCKLFLLNPKLKDLLTKKDRTTSTNKEELAMDLRNMNSSDSVPRVNSHDKENSTSVITDTDKTDTNICKLGLNISCVESTNKTWHSDIVQNLGDITTSTEVDIVRITKINDQLIPQNENQTIRENILGPESF